MSRIGSRHDRKEAGRPLTTQPPSKEEAGSSSVNPLVDQWITSSTLKLFSHTNAGGTVQLKQFDCRPPSWSPPHDARAIQVEMHSPIIMSRVEELNDLAGVWIH